MGNYCLKTKLKSAVDNSKLLKLGEILCTKEIEGETTCFTSGAEVTFRPISGNIEAYSSGTWYDEEIQGGFIRVRGVGSFAIGLNGKVASFRTTNVTTHNDFLFEYIRNCSMNEIAFDANNAELSLGEVKENNTLRDFGLSNCSNITGSLLNIASKFTNLRKVNLYGSSKIYGNVEDLASLQRTSAYNLEAINLYGVNLNEGHDSIEQLIQAIRIAGRVSSEGSNGISINKAATITVPSKLKFNGSIVTAGGSNVYITWTENTITFNGVTVEA